MSTIGFIGLGNMGGPMAINLVKAGHRVLGFDLSEAKLRRAGLDYHDLAVMDVHPSFDAALDAAIGAIFEASKS